MTIRRRRTYNREAWLAFATGLLLTIVAAAGTGIVTRHFEQACHWPRFPQRMGLQFFAHALNNATATMSRGPPNTLALVNRLQRRYECCGGRLDSDDVAQAYIDIHRESPTLWWAHNVHITSHRI